ncbi:hypothetical protein V498_02626 [Pseudogymnoascus sp. VKM F-4517 (FW-2822)]|nr:hypothetical protein V498_02626 [Pseudogymnoascus sp. VKM F-4517 (FW-2822)]
MKPKSKSGPVQLKPLLAATFQQARRLTHRHSHSQPPPATPPPVTPPPATMSPSTNSSSLFFTVLPPEIRALIYHFVFADQELLLCVRKFYTKIPVLSQLRHSSIKSDLAGGKWQAGWRGSVTRESPADNQYLEFKQEPNVTGKLLGLALCCQQVYAESIRFLYSSTGFTFWNQCPLVQFVEGDKRRADYMRWVRVMRLEFDFSNPVIAGAFDASDDPEYESNTCTNWDETCRCVGMMTGLEVLHVSIRPSCALAERSWASDMVWAMLELLKTVRADEFRVTVGKQFIKFREALGEAPFELWEAYEEY